MTPDHITLLVLIVASVMTANHARVTLRHRSSKGASMLSTFFFALMAAWNVFYYTTLAQWFSCAGSVLLFAAHAIWLALQWRFRNPPDDQLNFVRFIP